MGDSPDGAHSSSMTKKLPRPEDEDELRPEYDLSKLKLVGRGIFAERFRLGTNLALLERNAKEIPNLKMSPNQSTARDFFVLSSALGVDENDLLDYLNWCLLEHLVTTFSEDKGWIKNLQTVPNGMAQFKAVVEERTRLRWDVENVSKLYDRVMKATQRHYRKPITYEELIRLLINSPLKCSNSFCGKVPPKVKLHIDHTLPATKGGDSKFENLKFLCEQCNLSKSNKLERSGIWLTLESLQPF